jgi:GT2 family glycosyltransferase
MSSPPFLSLIIPTCHRNDLLANCLRHIHSSQPQELLREIEVIVCDDGIKTTAEKMIANDFSWARWSQGPHRGPASNRNWGAKQAKGQWLVFLDDDCQAESTWLSAIAHAAKTGAFDVLEGKTIAVDRADNPFKYYVENLSGGSFWSCNLAVRREVFESLAGFDEDFLEAGGEDMEFAYRIQIAKLRSLFLTEAVVIHVVRDVSFQSLVWRTRLIRWTILYQLKTGQGLSLAAPTMAVITMRLWQSCLNLLRSTWHLLTKHDQRRWRSQIFDVVWQWLTFPFVLFYLVVWEIRFRQQLKNRII